MGGLFEIPKGGGKVERCMHCAQAHSPLTLCKHEDLCRMVAYQRKNIVGLLKANTEAVDLARTFQKIIKQIEPKLSRMATFILNLTNMQDKIDRLKEREEILMDLGFKKNEKNEMEPQSGPENIPAEAPKP